MGRNRSALPHIERERSYILFTRDEYTAVTIALEQVEEAPPPFSPIVKEKVVRVLESILERAEREQIDKVEIDIGSIDPPQCPVCESEMILKRPSNGNIWPSFWGCPHFPKCKGKRTVYVVYSLNDPDTGEPFYVGMSSNVEGRFTQHLLSSRKDLDFASEKEKYIAVLVGNGKEPTCEILETCPSRQDASKRERYWIRKHLVEGHDLTNSIK